MTVIPSALDPSGEESRANREAMLGLLAGHDEELARARAGGGERYAARHRARGRLLVRERVEKKRAAGVYDRYNLTGIGKSAMSISWVRWSILSE